ncbi:TetR/AcrR family transcriptional regulator [Woodsholea maritima]|uniref:TetR/AcrR family transcriptional regulator n=1 Tax=Woodsholea maritima TaxID=240237 RepID=UPI0003A3073D|nr:TetR/AcrR family transcriptional regulator [Woodsholea maritima]
MSQGIKPARQARSEETRTKLLKAFGDLLREKSFDDLTVSEIAAHAGLAVGTVYRRFENKDAFIPVIFELYGERLAAFHNQYADLHSQAEGLYAAIRVNLELNWRFILSETPLVRSAYMYGRLRPDLVGEEWDGKLRAARDAAIAYLNNYPDEINQPVERAGEILVYMVNTVLVEKALYPNEGAAAALSLCDEAFLDAMANAVYGAVCAKPHP